jgi:hypothetical protein
MGWHDDGRLQAARPGMLPDPARFISSAPPQGGAKGDAKRALAQAMHRGHRHSRRRNDVINHAIHERVTLGIPTPGSVSKRRSMRSASNSVNSQNITTNIELFFDAFDDGGNEQVTDCKRCSSGGLFDEKQPDARFGKRQAIAFERAQFIMESH